MAVMVTLNAVPAVWVPGFATVKLDAVAPPFTVKLVEVPVIAALGGRQRRGLGVEEGDRGGAHAGGEGDRGRVGRGGAVGRVGRAAEGEVWAPV